MSDFIDRGHYAAFDAYFGKFLPTEKNAVIAELGCGFGEFVLWLQSLGFAKASGVDISEEQVALANHFKIPNIECGDILKFLEGKENQFDVLFARDVIEHFPKDEALMILDSCLNALKRGGILVLLTPNAESPFSGRCIYRDFTHDIAFTPSSIEQVARVTGFKEVEVYATGPVIHGFFSFIRYILWKIVECGIRFYLLIEIGSAEIVATQSMVIKMKK